jgi:hypothetical protein
LALLGVISMSDQCEIAWPLTHVEKRGIDNCAKIGPAERKFILTNKRGLSVLLQRLLIILLSAAAGVCLSYDRKAAAQQYYSAAQPNGPCVTQPPGAACSQGRVGRTTYNELENRRTFPSLSGGITIEPTIIERGMSLRWVQRDADGNILRVDFFQEMESGSR